MGLSDRLPAGFRRLADGLMVDHYDDPHVAFAVMVYPDRAPEIVAITDKELGASPLRKIVASDSPDAGNKPGRFFTADDLGQAEHAMSAALRALRWRDKGVPLGEAVAAAVELDWLKRRDFEADQQLKKDALEAARPMVCPHCRSRFTRRGFPVHLARARYCSQQEAKVQEADA